LPAILLRRYQHFLADVDPVYGATLPEALAWGVAVMAYAAVVTPQAITLNRRLPVVCP
jgi:sugar fermentation stimulation protein A